MAADTEIFTVTQLTRDIKTLIETEYPLVWVEGEISNFRVPSSGHFYFVLKDERAQIRAVMFRYQNQALQFEPEDGSAVLVLGRLTVYEPRGEYQIIIEKMEPQGRGALQLAFEQLKEKLRKEGLFSEKKKKPLPPFPKKVVVITSPTGAAIRDFIHVMDRRSGAMEIIIYPVRVQGKEAAGEIAAALDYVNARIEADAIVLTRGGGSLEDLWPFNEEITARAIFRSRVPVLSAVGHEIDFTISDFTADMRAPTPSAAAEILFPSRVDLVATVSNLESALKRVAQSKIARAWERFDNSSQRLKDPKRLLSNGWQRLDDAQGRLIRSERMWRDRKKHALESLYARLHLTTPTSGFKQIEDRINGMEKHLTLLTERVVERSRTNLDGLVERLNHANPLNVLERGYSITTTFPEGSVLMDAGATRSGDRVRVRLAKGTIGCLVEETEEEEKDTLS